MLDSMTPQEFDEWCVRDQIEPIGYAAKCLPLIAFYLSSFGGEELDPKLFMPWLEFEPDQVDNKAAKQLLTSILGRGKKRGNVAG